jgi:hypothetical protein
MSRIITFGSITANRITMAGMNKAINLTGERGLPVYDLTNCTVAIGIMPAVKINSLFQNKALAGLSVILNNTIPNVHNPVHKQTKLNALLARVVCLLRRNTHNPKSTAAAKKRRELMIVSFI